MRLFITLSRKSLAVILAVTIISLILIGQLFTIRSTGIDGSTNAMRVEYIESLGYIINETCTQNKSILIPEDFSDVYNKYNSLQKQAGFDLTAYKGKPADIYTYVLMDDTGTVVNIIVSDGCIIGGDVSQISINGEMKPLRENINEPSKT